MKGVADYFWRVFIAQILLMSPFASQLKSLRVGRGLRQMELAERVGYEQSYVSALELGIKGPPNEEFLDHLVRALQLTQAEQEAMHEAVLASRRKIDIPTEAPTEVYWLCHKFRQQLDRLHPTQIELIETALDLPLSFNLPVQSSPPRIKRRDQKIHNTGAKM